MNRFSNEMRFHFFQLRQNFNNKKMLRTSFILQVISMFVSNISFFIIWIIFSETIGTHNGWGTLQTFGMLSIAILVFGIVHSCFGSLLTWSEKVPTGAFDAFLTKPKSLYIRIINNDFNVGALGDLIQGILGLIIFLFLSHASFSSIIMILLMIIPGVLIQIAFLNICNCVMFWLPQAHNLPAALNNFILLPATQPISLLGGTMRFIYLFIIPALLVAGLPIEAFTHASWKIFFLSYAIAIVWVIISRWIMKISLRRYDSGNSIG